MNCHSYFSNLCLSHKIESPMVARTTCTFSLNCIPRDRHSACHRIRTQLVAWMEKWFPGFCFLISQIWVSSGQTRRPNLPMRVLMTHSAHLGSSSGISSISSCWLLRLWASSCYLHSNSWALMLGLNWTLNLNVNGSEGGYPHCLSQLLLAPVLLDLPFHLFWLHLEVFSMLGGKSHCYHTTLQGSRENWMIKCTWKYLRNCKSLFKQLLFSL